jgi:hypothetical protein
LLVGGYFTEVESSRKTIKSVEEVHQLLAAIAKDDVVSSWYGAYGNKLLPRLLCGGLRLGLADDELE